MAKVSMIDEEAPRYFVMVVKACHNAKLRLISFILCILFLFCGLVKLLLGHVRELFFMSLGYILFLKNLGLKKKMKECSKGNQARSRCIG